MTAILGISAFYHDSAAALLVDGRVVAAAQEERFTRRKHDAGFPTQAVAYCLREAGLSADDLDYIAFYDKPLAKFERLLETYLAFAPAGFRSFATALPVWLKEKLGLRRALRNGVGTSRARLVFLDHHQSHAASAFFPSPFQEAAVLTLDGVGEWTTTAYGVGRDHRLELTHQVRFPHSLGLLYSAFTYYCGFRVNSGEYKLMGLAPYGRPVYQDLIYKHLLDLKPDGSFRLNMQYFNYCQGLTMTNARFHRLFGGPPQKPESTLLQRHMDLAASIQAVAEEIVLRIARHVHQQTRQSNLVLAGGVALNCVANGRLLREGPFDSIWIQPAAGDAGGALGAAWFVWHQLLEKPRQAQTSDSQQGSFLGPSYSSAEVLQFLNRDSSRHTPCAVRPGTRSVPATLAESVRSKERQFLGASQGTEVPYYERSGDDVAYRRWPIATELYEHVATLLAEGKIVGWFQGRMEFGPRALGARSILGNPACATMQSDMNLKIKFRESFRPFAPCVLQEHAADWFDLPPGQESPYMLLVAQVSESRRTPLTPSELQQMEQDPDLRRRVNLVRSTIPAVTHVDYSARLQTVDEERNPRLHGLLTAFHRRTGCPVLVNTSFNVRGEPIVCTPEDAYRCFQATEMDVLVMEDVVVCKKTKVSPAAIAMRERHLAQFQLD